MDYDVLCRKQKDNKPENKAELLSNSTQENYTAWNISL